MASLIRRKYKGKDKSGSIVQKQSPYWYIDYKSADGTRKRIKGFKDKAATAQLAAKVEREAELAGAGFVDKYAKHRKTPLLNHAEDFRKSLLAKGDTIAYARLTVYRIKKILSGCGFALLADIQASKAQQYLANLRDGEDGLSSQTSNYYLQALKQFSRWMVQDGRASESPIQHLKGVNVRVDRRHDRRALEPHDLRQLLATTATGPERFGMSGYERYLLYRFAAETGLRANEVRKLKVRDFDFDNLTVEVKAGYSKRKREDTQLLRQDTATLLKEFLKGKLPSAKAFGGRYKQLTKRTAQVLKADLADAGITYVDDAGRHADFHALRHTTGSLLAASGAHPKVAQSIMRHSDINLTMSRYTHTLAGQEAKAVADLPDLSLPADQKQAATGTDDQPANPSETVYQPVYKKLAKNAYSDGRRLSSDGISEGAQTISPKQDKGSRKPVQLEGLGTRGQEMSTVGSGGKKEWAGVDLNHRHTDFQSVALPTELPAL